MKNNKLKLAVALGCALGLAAPASVFATNGMFLIGYGTKSRGMGGVGITQSHDVMTSAANPATLSQLKTNRFDIGADIFIVDSVAYQGVGEDKVTVESTPDHMAIADGIYLFPALGASFKDGDLTYGFTMVPVGGGGSRYDFNLFNCANSAPANCNDKLGVSLAIMNINPSIALQINENHSVGATLILGLQVFKAYGLGDFTQFTVTQSETTSLTDNGTDISYGAGIRLGWLGTFDNKKLTLGAEFTSKTYMTEFDKYSELFAEQGDLDTPGNIGLGIAYSFTDALLVALDINYVMYEDVKSISNAGPNISGSPFPIGREENALGADGGLGFGWNNQTIFKLGVSYDLTPAWTLRGGWNYAESPLDENTDILFSTVAPAISQNHLTLGGTWQMAEDMELSFSYIHAFKYEQFGPTFINNEGGFTMQQNAFGASFGMNF